MDEKTHYVYYGDDGEDDRQFWECTTCSRSGSVGPYADPELAAETAHARDGVSALGRTSRRPW